MNRRMLFWIALLLPWFAGCGGPAQMTIICPWASGGGTDRVSRFWADALKKELGRPVVVVNRTGGSGSVGHTAGARAKPNGDTLTMITFELSTMHRMGISPLTHEDFKPLLQVNADPAAILVKSNAPWMTLRELLDHIKENPDTVKMSGTASGGAWDLARAGLLQADGIPVESVIWMPNNGAAPSLVDLIGGHVDAVCCSIPEASQAIESGELRVLAVLADERMADYPEVPTAKELGIPWSVVGWRGLALPKDTPDEIAQPLEAACQKIGDSEAYRSFMEKNGFGVRIAGSEEFRKFLVEQDATWKSVVEAAGYAEQ